MKTTTRIVEALLGEGTFCPSSGRVIARGPDTAGRPVKCPTCGKTVVTEYRKPDNSVVLPDHGKSGKWESVEEGFGDSGKSAKLSSGERSKINGGIHSVTLNKYFNSPGEAIATINHVMKPVGYFIMATSDHMGGADGHKNLPIHKEHPAGTDPFMGHDQVENCWLSFSWHRMDSGRYEITAYVS